MSKSLKLTLSSIVALAVLAGAAALLSSRVDVKARFETLASDATGMQVTVGGQARVPVFPVAHVTLADVRVRNNGAEIASVGEADVAVALWPLLYREVRISGVVLQNLGLRSQGIATAN